MSSTKPTSADVVWLDSVKLGRTSLCGHLNVDKRCLEQALKSRDPGYIRMIEGLHSMPAFRGDDPAWLSIAKYQMEVPEVLQEATFAEWVARLVTLSNGKGRFGDFGKSSFEFQGTFNGEVFTLYDYKGDQSLHIGGNPAILDVVHFRRTLWKALAEVTTLTPFQTQCNEYHDKLWGYPDPAVTTVQDATQKKVSTVCLLSIAAGIRCKKAVCQC